MAYAKHIGHHNFIYIAFYRFGQGKLGLGVKILGSNQFTLLPQMPQKNDVRFKSGQNGHENNHLVSLI